MVALRSDRTSAMVTGIVLAYAILKYLYHFTIFLGFIILV